MDQSMLKYAIRVDERAAFIRFYLWLWDAKINQITFCKLFWAYVFTPPALLGRGILGIAKGVLAVLKIIAFPLGWVLRKFHERELAPPHGRPTPKPVKRKKEKPKGPSSMQRALGGIEHAGTLASMKGRPFIEKGAEGVGAVKERVAYAGRRTATSIGAAVSIPWVGKFTLVCAALLGLSAMGVAAHYAIHPLAHTATILAGGTVEAAGAIVHSEYSLWTILGMCAFAVVICIVWAAIALGIPYLLVKYIFSPAETGISAGSRVIGGGAKGFAEAMKLGYYGVKTNTCPRIEVEKRPDPTKIKRIQRELKL